MPNFGKTLWEGTKSVGSALGKAGGKIASGAKAAANSSVGKSFLSELGIVEKAVIEIADFSERKITEENAKAPGGGKGGMKGGLSGFDEGLAKSYAAKIEKAKAIAGKANGSDAGSGDVDDFDINKDYKKYRFEVPFNPAELTLTGYGGEEIMVQKFNNQNMEEEGKGEQKKKDPENHKKERSNAIRSVESHIELSIPLIFDKTNNQDAFYGDKFTLGATNVARGVGKLAKKGVGAIRDKISGKGGGGNGRSEYSVQNEVEAFTHIIRSTATCLIKFTWGDMSYEGILNRVDCEYTMFNVNGEPCRASVNLRVVLLDSEYTDMTRIWRAKLKKNAGVDEQDELTKQIGNKAPEGAH